MLPASQWAAPRSAAAKRPNLVCGSVQICWQKFSRYWDVELREVEMSAGELCLTPERMLEQVDENTIAVVATLGVTYHGLYENVAVSWLPSVPRIWPHGISVWRG